MISVLIACVILVKKNRLSIYSIFIGGYLLLMVFTEVFFDRYILNIFPFFMLFLLDIAEAEKLNQKYVSAFIAPFVLFLAFFSFQLARDFIGVNNFIWSKSQSLVEGGIDPTNIKATHAWTKLHGYASSPEFLFSYDSVSINEDLAKRYQLIQTFKPSYKGNLFIEPIVYLYKKLD